MGVLRIKESVEELLEKDPYELFTLDEPHRFARKLRPEFFGAAFIGVVIAFAVAFFTFWNVQQDAKEASDAPYAYFEVKAIDPDGRLVAGALVKGTDKVLGVTDSFGEWRRFMRVKPGTTVPLTLTKKIAGGTLSAVKNIAVPMTMPKGGDLELTGSVQLARVDGKGITASVASEVPVESEKKVDVEPAAAAAASQEVEEIVPAAGESAAMVQDFSRVWVMADGQAPAALGGVIAAVRKRLRELGVRVDPASNWRIKLTELNPGGDQKALIAIESTYAVSGLNSGQPAAPTRLFSYLRNYQDTPLQTARDILWSVTTHLAKTHQVVKKDGAWLVQDEGAKLFALSPGRVVFDAGGIGYVVEEGKEGAAGLLKLGTTNSEPCATGTSCMVTTGGVERNPPVPGWQRLKVKVFGAVSEDTTIYVSGYAARPYQDKVFEYWGVPMSGANVTAVRAGRLVFRGRIQSGGGTLPTINLPSMPLSRR